MRKKLLRSLPEVKRMYTGFQFTQQIQRSTSALGSLTGGNLADALGRRAAFLLCCVPLLAGPLLCAWAASFTQLAAGRLITGVAIGLSSALVSTYISEVAPTKLRGTLGTINQLVICIGILAVLCVNVALPVTQWRSFFLLGAVPAVLLGLGMLAVCPESPRWLASKGRNAEAESAARSLWGPGGVSELSGGAAPDAGGDKSKEGEASMFAPRYRKGVLIGILLFAIQQFAGINALVYFSTSVFRQAGVQSDTLASAAVGVTNVLGTVVAASIIEKAGRKQLLANSYLGQAAAMLLMAFGFASPALSQYAAPIAVVGTLLYIVTFALGAGPVTGLLVPELCAASIRGRAVAAAMTSHWVCNVAVGQTFMAAVTQFGLAGCYAAFGVVALLGAFFVRSQVPETKGKTFDQIEAELNA
ncbi:general substrate transporter [Dunaliella salina]|uniref:General substrate transporter n=1 Tax=Dunaliella salina TaxID=3046 RepID=A0ABQ7GCQ9_DUNSA|nr:general substrate transporter [Dunaliella salina]|eukprot:KAF5832364.1 general substrate transporter [Dunaliella salina]